ncbi:hypothetical protein D9M72_607290 [compost metagenome]
MSNGSRICGLDAPRITGRLNDGFSALNSSSVMSASLAARFTSISRDVVTVTKYGWSGISGSLTPYTAGLAMMFLTACSFGT